MSEPKQLPEVVVKFREMSGAWARGTAVVSARDAAGDLHGMTLRAMTPVCFLPMRLLICIGEKSRTYAAMRETGSFCVNILAADQEAQAIHFGGSQTDKFNGQEYDLLPSGLPALRGTLGTIECAVGDIVPNAYHHVVFGDVQSYDTRLGDPLVCYGPGFARLGAPAGPTA
jgi:flavin reductase (DIM6/NTAB) family NADH-FMN oxidoreductase RutF